MIIPFSRPRLTTKISGGVNVYTFGFHSEGRSVGPPVKLKFSRHYYLFSPTQMYIRFGFTPRDLHVLIQVTDTHDGFKKKKKKKKQKSFAEEIDRREKLRKQIEEVIHPPIVEVVPLEEEPEVKPVREIQPVELKSLEPITDYAGIAKDQIVAKARQDAIIKAHNEQQELQRRLELKRREDEEEERELEMILGEIL